MDYVEYDDDKYSIKKKTLNAILALSANTERLYSVKVCGA